MADRFPCDTHIHTSRCGHAGGRDEEYVEAAIAGGLAAVALTDHAPFYWLSPERRDPRLAMASEDLPRYVEEVLALAARYRGQIEVLLGLEADYIAGREEVLVRLLEAYPFDVVLGSVHFLDGWLVDAPSSLARLDQGQEEVDRVWARYAELLIAAAGSGLFDVLTHLDLPKKFGHRPSLPFAGRQSEIVAAVAASSCAVELSSAGRRRPVEEDYPAPDLQRELASAGVAFVLSSDAHAPAEVGFGFDELAANARAAGVSEVLVFRRRRGTPVGL
ncbi:MAG TPA: histidinol-phosphatase HisJ family protein [Thermoanaerobaculaceae bacterium]|nr:histidinol-phosphatase HisJ family protein [Thermoanaerobaculaceae bacterium]